MPNETPILEIPTREPVAPARLRVAGDHGGAARPLLHNEDECGGGVEIGARLADESQRERLGALVGGGAQQRARGCVDSLAAASPLRLLR